MLGFWKLFFSHLSRHRRFFVDHLLTINLNDGSSASAKTAVVSSCSAQPKLSRRWYGGTSDVFVHGPNSGASKFKLKLVGQASGGNLAVLDSSMFPSPLIHTSMKCPSPIHHQAISMWFCLALGGFS
jgi:hypothetical protein